MDDLSVLFLFWSIRKVSVEDSENLLLGKFFIIGNVSQTFPMIKKIINHQSSIINHQSPDYQITKLCDRLFVRLPRAPGLVRCHRITDTFPILSCQPLKLSSYNNLHTYTSSCTRSPLKVPSQAWLMSSLSNSNSPQRLKIKNFICLTFTP